MGDRPANRSRMSDLPCLNSFTVTEVRFCDFLRYDFWCQFISSVLFWLFEYFSFCTYVEHRFDSEHGHTSTNNVNTTRFRPKACQCSSTKCCRCSSDPSKTACRDDKKKFCIEIKLKKYAKQTLIKTRPKRDMHLERASNGKRLLK